MTTLMMIVLLSSLSPLPPSDSPPKIIYVGDPMCSWCYGIAPELQKLAEHYEGKMAVEVVAGGLRPYNKETMIELADFLKEHWREVEQASGQPFNTAILDREGLYYDTEPACRAVVTVRQMAPEQALDFFRLIQAEFYFNNVYLSSAEAFRSTLEKLDIDFNDFKAQFESEEMKAKVKEDFYTASRLGVRSFPTLLLEVDGKVRRIANGYAKAVDMIRNIDAALTELR